jgi:hypothetical protein
MVIFVKPWKHARVPWLSSLNLKELTRKLEGISKVPFYE